MKSKISSHGPRHGPRGAGEGGAKVAVEGLPVLRAVGLPLPGGARQQVRRCRQGLRALPRHPLQLLRLCAGAWWCRQAQLLPPQVNQHHHRHHHHHHQQNPPNHPHHHCHNHWKVLESSTFGKRVVYRF